MSPPWLGDEKRFWVLEALKTADWHSKIGDNIFFRSGFSSLFGK